MTPAADGRRDLLKQQIAALTDRVVSAQVIARAIVAGQKRTKGDGMTPKLQALAGRLKDVTAKIDARAAGLIERLDNADKISADNASRVNAELDKIEEAVRNVEDLANQMTNNGPPLDGSSDFSRQ